MAVCAALVAPAMGQTNLTVPVTLNQKPAFDSAALPTPTAGTYLIAMSGRLRGEYILSVEAPYIAQTVHLIVNANQFDGGPTIQILDNHSYNSNAALSNFRVMIPSSNAVAAYLLMDVSGVVASNSIVNIQYQGSAGYSSGLGSAGGTIPSGLMQVGGPVLAVNESNVGIGTASPGAQLGVGGGVVIDQYNNNPGGLDLRLGYPSGEGIGSPRTVGAVNRFGIDFYTGGTPRATLTNGGYLGIGTRTPSQMLEVNGNIKLAGGIAFPDGNQWNAWPGPSAPVSAGTNASFGRITVGNSAPDGQGAASQGIVFSDTLNGNGASGQWTHAAIHSVGESGYNGDLVFSTDGDGQLNNNPTEKMRIMYDGRVGIGTSSPQAKLDVNGDIRISANGGKLIFPDGSVQSTANSSSIAQSNGNTAVNNALFVGGGSNPTISTQGTYITWNMKTGGTGETDFINHKGGGTGGFAFYNTGGNGSSKSLSAFLDGNGNMGLGTGSPAQRLEVNGNIQLTTNSGAHIIFPDGSQQSVAWTGTLDGGDYAESVDVSGSRSQFEPGDLLVIDTEHHGRFLKASTAYSTLVSGVFATKPGVTGRRQPRSKSKDDEVPMAMVGIVPTKVSTENGPIRDGDLLVSSSTPGFAMRGTDRSRLTGAVLGKALGSLEGGTGVIEVLISLQ